MTRASKTVTSTVTALTSVWSAALADREGKRTLADREGAQFFYRPRYRG